MKFAAASVYLSKLGLGQHRLTGHGLIMPGLVVKGSDTPILTCASDSSASLCLQRKHIHVETIATTAEADALRSEKVPRGVEDGVE